MSTPALHPRKALQFDEITSLLLSLGRVSRPPGQAETGASYRATPSLENAKVQGRPGKNGCWMTTLALVFNLNLFMARYSCLFSSEDYCFRRCGTFWGTTKPCLSRKSVRIFRTSTSTILGGVFCSASPPPRIFAHMEQRYKFHSRFGLIDFGD